jgi:hypothetical protein
MNIPRWHYARAAVGVAAPLVALSVMVSSAAAVGAFAVGACGAYGYAYAFHSVAQARITALRKCAGRGCRLVGVIRHGCAALVIDSRNACGSYGWAIHARLGSAENSAMRRCYQFGGRTCVVRAFVCDRKD